MPRNCDNNFGNSWSGLRVLRLGFCAFFAFACIAGIAVISGCGKVTVAGRERNIVEHGRIRGEIELSAQVQESTSSGPRIATGSGLPGTEIPFGGQYPSE